MSEQSYFQNALSNFVHDAASGGSIRHLTDQGYTVKQISKLLDFPTPIERVRRQVWERLLETEVILTAEPGSKPREKAEYVREYDRYGKSSFRRVMKITEDVSVAHWHEIVINCTDQKKTHSLLADKIAENGENRSYAACEFGLLLRKDPMHFSEQMMALDKAQREYIEGLPWEVNQVYHRLNSRMLEILLKLSSKGLWRGDCFFLKTRERIRIQ